MYLIIHLIRIKLTIGGTLSTKCLIWQFIILKKTTDTRVTSLLCLINHFDTVDQLLIRWMFTGLRLIQVHWVSVHHTVTYQSSPGINLGVFANRRVIMRRHSCQRHNIDSAQPISSVHLDK